MLQSGTEPSGVACTTLRAPAHHTNLVAKESLEGALVEALRIPVALALLQHKQAACTSTAPSRRMRARNRGCASVAGLCRTVSSGHMMPQDSTAPSSIDHVTM